MATDEGQTTKQNLIERIKKLNVVADFFDNANTHPYNYVPSEGYERTFYIKGSTEVAFRDENSKEVVYHTKGDLQVDVPSGVTVAIWNAKIKIVEKKR